MFLQLLLAILLGLLFGTITGLVPGVHINLIAVMLISSSPVFLQYTNPTVLAVFIIAMSVTHTFMDTIPSIFLGAPEADTALGVLPGHRYLLKGQGMMAVKLTLIGSFGAVILSVFLFPLFLPIVETGYPIIKEYIAYILIAAVVFMILRDRKKLWALLVFLLAGTLGLIVLNSPFTKPLFPMLSGIFGISTLLISLNESQSIPPQKKEQRIKLRRITTTKALLSGQFSGFLTAVLPGIGGATAAIMSLQITRDLGDNGFMVLMGSINTVNFILSIATLYVLDKARNGSIIAVKELINKTGLNTIIIFLATTLIAGCAGVFLVLKLGSLLAEKITKINYYWLIIGVIAFITLLVCILSGFSGFLILITSTGVGLLPALKKITRTHGMGCLLLPIIFYFLL